MMINQVRAQHRDLVRKPGCPVSHAPVARVGSLPSIVTTPGGGGGRGMCSGHSVFERLYGRRREAGSDSDIFGLFSRTDKHASSSSDRALFRGRNSVGSDPTGSGAVKMPAIRRGGAAGGGGNFEFVDDVTLSQSVSKCRSWLSTLPSSFYGLDSTLYERALRNTGGSRCDVTLLPVTMKTASTAVSTDYAELQSRKQ